MTIKKRGRPVGSKTKKVINRVNIKSFSDTLKEWDEKENKVDFKELCQKLQNALSLAYVELDALKQKTQLDRQAIIIEYLESRIK
jgi:ppGpp synthetase/RelA/SpoT-type nucleotidyltranferase